MKILSDDCQPRCNVQGLTECVRLRGGRHNVDFIIIESVPFDVALFVFLNERHIPIPKNALCVHQSVRLPLDRDDAWVPDFFTAAAGCR